MNFSTTLLHFDNRVAICSVSLKADEQQITLYASALASESPRYADLAQNRAAALALEALEEGLTALRDRPLPIEQGITPTPGPGDPSKASEPGGAPRPSHPPESSDESFADIPPW